MLEDHMYRQRSSASSSIARALKVIINATSPDLALGAYYSALVMVVDLVNEQEHLNRLDRLIDDEIRVRSGKRVA
jgi:hypothetical protein